MGGSRSLEHEPGDMRVEDLGEVEPEEMPADMGYDQEQQDKTQPEEGKEEFKKRGYDHKNTSPRITKKPTIIGSAYDAYQKEPAYIAPIGPIGPIPAVVGVEGVGSPKPSSPPRHINGEDHISSSGRPRIPRWVTARLVGKMIDEYGNVVDNDGSVLGRVAGDLPSMVGRTVLNKSGDVLGDDGELLGYVAEIADRSKGKGKDVEMEEGDEAYAEAGLDLENSEENEDEKGASSHETSSPKSIDQYIGKPSASLHVDHRGNILDSLGNIIGHFRDTSKDPKPDEGTAGAAAAGSQDGSKKPMPDHPGAQGPAATTPGPGADPRQGDSAGGAAGSGERPKNAADWKKENESPSDIFLDVKSTTEGIQLTIRIPTVFAGQQPRFNFTS